MDTGEDPASPDGGASEDAPSNPLVELCRGRVAVDKLRVPKKKMVRMYLTATPDMQEEQHMVMTKFFPAMRARCAIEYDLDLQVVAPHWNTGMPEENFGDEFIELCLSEIRTCERVAEIPIYVALIGTNYGWRPPPTCLGKREFDYLVRHLRKIDINGPAFLRGWFEEDKNTDPSHVVLKFPKFLQDEAKSEIEEDAPPPSTAKPDLPAIARYLRISARAAAEAGHIEPADIYKYERSVVDAEINYGFLSSNEVKRRSLFFIRDIKNINHYVNSSRKASSFLALDGPMFDSVAASRLAELRDQTIPGCVVEDAIFRWDLEYEDSNAYLEVKRHLPLVVQAAQKFRTRSLLHITKYNNYMEQLYKQLCQEVERIIEMQLATSPPSEDASYHDKMAMEIAADWKKAERLSTAFHGREETLKLIKSYFEGAADMPYVVSGEASIGKSTLLARIALDLHYSLMQPPEQPDSPLEPVLVLRFLDRAPLPCNVEDLLFSLCSQIAMAYSREGPDSHDVSDLMDIFQECLTYSSEQKPLFVLLDGLEHVSTPVTMDETDWVPDWLPPYTKVLMSIGTNEDDALFQELREKIPSDENFFELGQLSEIDAFKYVQGTLHESGRGLAEKQAIAVALLVQGCPHPVFLRLLTDMTLSWPSFYYPDPENPPVQPAVEAIITLMLKQLEFKHGSQFVADCLAYLSSARRGLREPELLDIMSLDDALLGADVFPSSSPSPRRFPCIMWLRLKWELSLFLEMRESDGHVVLCWTNELVRRSICNRYLPGSDRRQQIHRLMADYFLGTWAHRQKSFRFTEELGGGMGVARMGSEERFVAPQPLMFCDLSQFYGKSRPNKRKLSELPYHLLQGDRITDLGDQVLYNYTWLHTRILTSSLNDLIEDLEDILNTPAMRASRDLEILIEALQDSESTINIDVSFLKAELTSRLVQYLGRYTDLTHLVRMCDLHGFHHNKISPITPLLASSKDEVIHVQKTDTGLDGHIVICPTNMQNYIVVYTMPQRLIFWNLTSGDKVQFECESNAYYSFLYNSNFRECTFALNDGNPKYNYLDDTIALDIYENDSMSRIRRISFERNHGIRLRKLYRLTCLTDRKVVFETVNHAAIYVDSVRLVNLGTGEELETELHWPFLLTPDETYLLVSNVDAEGVWVREFPSCKTVAKLLAPKHVTAIVVIDSCHGVHVLVSAGSCGLLCLFSLEDLSDEEIAPIMVSPILTKSHVHVKGGIGELIMSTDNEIILAVGVHSKGKYIYQRNYVSLLNDLSVLGSYHCDRGDVSTFSNDNKYIFHLRRKKHEIAIYDSLLVSEIAVYSLSTGILQCVPTDAGATALITTTGLILEVDMETVVKRELAKREGMGEEDEEEDDLSTEETQPHKRAIYAEMDSFGYNPKELEPNIPLNIIIMDKSTGLVETETAVLHRGEHFTEFDLPAFSLGSGMLLTPDGLQVLGLCDQVHVWWPKRSTVIMVIPLVERTGYTKVFTNTEIDRQMIARSGKLNTSFLCKDVPKDGIELEKGAYIYRELGTRKHLMYEARGGEVIQRIPSIIRVYDVLTRALKSIIRIQNEKIVTCNNSTLVTVNLVREFTNLYNLCTGDQIITIECRATLAMFCPAESDLLMVARDLKNTIKIYNGHSFLDCRRIRVTKRENESVSDVRSCTSDPQIVVIRISRVADPLYNITDGTEYMRMDLEKEEILARFEPKSDIVHVSPNAEVAVDRDFHFYDLTAGVWLFHYSQGTVCAPHLSYFTDDGDYLMFLDTEPGTLNVINVHKQQLLSKCMYHKYQSELDRLQGRHSMSTLLPLYGGYFCVLLDGSQLKQFTLSNFECWKALTVPDTKLERAYSSAVKRATFLHDQYKEEHSPVELTNIVHKFQFKRAATMLTMGFPMKSAPQILAL